MIPRYQRILFWTLTIASLLMITYLVYMHRREDRRTMITGDDTPIAAPVTSAAENVTFLQAHDEDGNITPMDRSIALPSNSTVRARALLEHLLADYALPDSPHPLPGGIAVDDVFLLPLPLTPTIAATKTSAHAVAQLPSKAEESDPLTHTSGELAVVNLRSTWTDAHPSGAETETLTLLSIIGTLHANMPEITHIRFLVDGQPRETLAGHVDLKETFPATETATQVQ